MNLLAHSTIGRAVLHGAIFTLRPLRFLLGFSTRTVRPLHVLIAL